MNDKNWRGLWIRYLVSDALEEPAELEEICERVHLMFNKGDPTPDRLFWSRNEQAPTKEEVQQALRTLSHDGPLSEAEVFCQGGVWSLLSECLKRHSQADYFDWR